MREETGRAWELDERRQRRCVDWFQWFIRWRPDPPGREHCSVWSYALFGPTQQVQTWEHFSGLQTLLVAASRDCNTVSRQDCYTSWGVLHLSQNKWGVPPISPDNCEFVMPPKQSKNIAIPALSIHLFLFLRLFYRDTEVRMQMHCYITSLWCLFFLNPKRGIQKSWSF